MTPFVLSFYRSERLEYFRVIYTERRLTVVRLILFYIILRILQHMLYLLVALPIIKHRNRNSKAKHCNIMLSFVSVLQSAWVLLASGGAKNIFSLLYCKLLEIPFSYNMLS